LGLQATITTGLPPGTLTSGAKGTWFHTIKAHLQIDTTFKIYAQANLTSINRIAAKSQTISMGEFMFYLLAGYDQNMWHVMASHYSAPRLEMTLEEIKDFQPISPAGNWDFAVNWYMPNNALDYAAPNT